MTNDQSTKYSNWYHVKTVSVFINAAYVTYSAFNDRGQRTMSHFIPRESIDKVDVHYLNPNRKRKPEIEKQYEGKTIFDLDDATIQDLK